MEDSTALTGRSWKQIVAPYCKANPRKAWTQLLNSFLPFVLIWYLMLRSLEVSYWLTLLLALPAAGLVMRMFIFQHDCGHGSFFRSQKVNNALGFCLGVLTLTPYSYWRRTHAIHHATSGNLDRREFGDIDTLTVEEYRGLSFWGRWRYRFYRNFFVLTLLGGTVHFVLKHRFPFDIPRSWKKEWASVMWTNAAIVAVVVVMSLMVGFGRFVMVQAPITVLTGALGVWLFYVQHQFEDTYWKKEEDWDFTAASLDGSSYYDLPPILDWFTGYIGYHHIHHLASRIPNYNLRRCARENEELNDVTRITVWQSIKCFRLKLWDEEQGKLIGFRELRARYG